jgi:hypothetical protein
VKDLSDEYTRSKGIEALMKYRFHTLSQLEIAVSASLASLAKPSL